MGLKGEEIDKFARCVSLADVFDALTSKRPYKEVWPNEKAYEEILSQSGKQFDPIVVEVFKSNFNKFKEIQEKYQDE